MFSILLLALALSVFSRVFDFAARSRSLSVFPCFRFCSSLSLSPCFFLVFYSLGIENSGHILPTHVAPRIQDKSSEPFCIPRGVKHGDQNLLGRWGKHSLFCWIVVVLLHCSTGVLQSYVVKQAESIKQSACHKPYLRIAQKEKKRKEHFSTLDVLTFTSI